VLPRPVLGTSPGERAAAEVSRVGLALPAGVSLFTWTIPVLADID
jgi:hypothetical protein